MSNGDQQKMMYQSTVEQLSQLLMNDWDNRSALESPYLPFAKKHNLLYRRKRAYTSPGTNARIPFREYYRREQSKCQLT